VWQQQQAQLHQQVLQLLRAPTAAAAAAAEGS
jgi:hypothetical protein